jgi:putative methionine-R-sulfoxide reductase with GAF domain
MNFKEIGNNGLVEGFAIIKQCDKKTAKNGNTYLDIVLADKDGEIFGVLDIDSPVEGRFDDADRRGLEGFVRVLETAITNALT